MFINETTKSKVFAVMAAALMLCVCLVGLVATDSDAETSVGSGTQDDPYNVYVREGDTFIYSPAYNLSNVTTSVVEASSNSAFTNANCITNEGTTFTYVFQSNDGGTTTEGAVMQLVLKGTWTSNTGSSNGEITQQAYQYINFHVFNNLKVSSQNAGTTNTLKFYVIAGQEPGNKLKTFSPGNGSDNVAYTVSLSGKDSGYFELDGNDLKQKEAINTANTYEATVTYTSNDDARQQTVVFNIELHVVGSLSITNDGDVFNTYPEPQSGYVEGTEPTNSVELVTNYSDSSDYSGYTWELNSGTDTRFFSLSNATSSKAILSWHPTSEYVNPNVNNATAAKPITAVVKVTGTFTDPGTGETRTSSDTRSFTVDVYPTLAFMSSPNASHIRANSFGSNPLDMAVTGQYAYASKVKYIWGDGTPDTEMTIEQNGEYTARHLYKNYGTYQITVISSNAFGEKADVILYKAADPNQEYTVTCYDGEKSLGEIKTDSEGMLNAKDIKIPSGNKLTKAYIDAEKTQEYDFSLTYVVNGSPEALYVTYEKTSFFDEHGWIWIVFLILAVFMFFNITKFILPIPYKLSLAIMIVSIILAVGCFFTGGLMDLWDEIKSFFDGVRF